ncbi:MAG: hypothetical protein P4L84_23745 [Isosphaeraceae bacterium]|nr:hypothetical protein [Isosphaeraceae bacterium]
MRFGNWRGVALAFAVSTILAVPTGSARAGGYTIPREVTAVDVNTGGPYFAPPVPYGHYAKDCLGTIHNGIGAAKGSLLGLFHKGCGACGGKGCGLCGGSGHCGGDPSCGGGWNRCNACGGGGCGFCQGLGLFRGHGHKDPCAGGCNGHASTIIASAQAAPAPSPQANCGVGGCGLKFKHSHHRGLGRGCGSCGGRGCGLCGGDQFAGGDPCGSCGGRGCGLCGGGGFGHGGCNACGGKGCGLCAGKHNLLGLPHALLNKVLHKGDIKYFVGAGGPVPLTPGYVPYVVSTRSPRDYFAFPPFSE